MSNQRYQRLSPMRRLSRSLPYLSLIALAVFLFHAAGQIDFKPPSGRIAPDFWPKLILGLLILVCMFEVARNILFSDPAHDGDEAMKEKLKDDGGDWDDSDKTRYPNLVAYGIALAIGYAWLIDKLGFLTCTFLFLIAFAYVGRYRRHGVILATSLVGSIALMFLFMRIVYISLPIGIEPFSQISLTAMKLMGIK